MTKRLAMTPAVGLFAGLSVVSYGAVNMLLNGVHGIRDAASTNPCSSSAVAGPALNATAARPLPRTRTVSHVSGRTQHPAAMPMLLAAVVRPASGQTSPPLPSTQPSPTTSSSTLPQPSPNTSATPASALPQPEPAHSATSTKQQLTPGGTNKTSSASPTQTSTPTPSTSPTTTTTPTSTPTPTTPPPTTPPPSGTLCLKIQTLNNVSSVDPHKTVRYAIWVWLSKGTNSTAKITLSASPSSVSPTFTVCEPSGRSRCTVGGLDAGRKAQLEAKLKAPGRSHHHVTLTATATSAQASNSASASATVIINRKRSSGGDPSSSQTQNAGDGGILPPANELPTGLISGAPGTVPGLGVQPTGDLGSAFPQVSPSPSGSGASGSAANHGHSTKAINLSAGLPLDVRLIGGQLIGLAVLAAAVTIAVARLSLRRQPQAPGEDGPGKS